MHGQQNVKKNRDLLLIYRLIYSVMSVFIVKLPGLSGLHTLSPFSLSHATSTVHASR